MTAFTHDTAAQVRGPDWLRERRAAALERFDDTGLPTEAEEVWRYSRISELDLDAYSPVVDGAPDAGVPDGAAAAIDAIGERAGLLVTRNGRVAHVDMQDSRVEVTDLLGAADGDDLLGSVAA